MKLYSCCVCVSVIKLQKFVITSYSLLYNKVDRKVLSSDFITVRKSREKILHYETESCVRACLSEAGKV